MEEINLYDLLRFYARKWLAILTIVMIGAIVGIIYTFFVQQPQYKSTATLLVVGTNRTSAQDSVVINNYVELFKSRRVLEPIIASLEYTGSYNTLAAHTTAANTKDTDIINVSISASDPNTSKALLKSAIERFSDEAATLYGDSSIKLNVVDPADTPDQPTNVKPLQQIGLTTMAALVLAIIAYFFIYDYRSSRTGLDKQHAPVNKPVSEPATAKKSSTALIASVKKLAGRSAISTKKSAGVSPLTNKITTKSAKKTKPTIKSKKVTPKR